MRAPRRCARRSASRRAAGGVSSGSRQPGTTIVPARARASSPAGAAEGAAAGAGAGRRLGGQAEEGEQGTRRSGGGRAEGSGKDPDSEGAGPVVEEAGKGALGGGNGGIQPTLAFLAGVRGGGA